MYLSLNSLIILFCKLFMLMNYFIILMINNMILKWLIIEISTILFIMIINLTSNNKILSTYYFMISSMSSILMVLLILFFYSNLFYYNLNMNLISQLIYLMKLGLLPFSMWLIYCFEKFNWNEIFFMSTIMKFMPMILIMEMTKLNYFFILFLFMNMFFISIYSFKFNSLKKILACSSINQSSFFLILIFLNKFIFFIYSLIYMYLMYMLIYMMKKMNLLKKYDLYKIYQSKNLNFIFSMVIFMYSCLPPFTSSMIKWLLSYKLISYNLNFSLIMLIMTLPFIIMIWNYFNFSKFSLNNYIMMKKNYFNKLYFNNFFLLMFMMNLMLIILFNLF